MNSKVILIAFAFQLEDSFRKIQVLGAEEDSNIIEHFIPAVVIIY